MEQSERDALVQKRLQELAKQREVEEKAKLIAKSLLEPAAFERLMNVKLSSPELFDQALSALIYLQRQGKISRKITEEEFKQLLARLLPQKKQTSIKTFRK